MGNVLGYRLENAVNLYRHPEVTPRPLEEPTFDPKLGFPKGRKPRVMVATPAEMESAKIPLHERGYCAHKLIAFQECYRSKFPWAVKCAHEKHDFLTCKYDDYVLRMKEYERERRLKVKQEEQRKEQAIAA